MQKQNSAYVCKWKGKAGYSGRGRPSFAFLSKKSGEKTWKNKPGYSGRGRPSAILLAQYKGRVEDAPKNAPAPQPLLDDEGPLADIDENMACDGAPALKVGDPDGPDSQLKEEMEAIREIEKKAQAADDIGNIRNARMEWRRAAERYESLRLFSSAAMRFKMAWEWERAGHAFMNIREYKHAAEAFDKAKRQDLADKVYLMAAEKAEKECRYGMAALMFEKCGHFGVANKMRKKEKALAPANSSTARRVTR